MEGLFTKAVDILYIAKQNGVEIILNDGRLQLKFPEDKSIDDELLNEIRANKEILIDFLSNEDWNSTPKENYSDIPVFDRTAVYPVPLSFSQERLWFVDKLEGSIAYNGPIVLRLTGKVNTGILEKSLRDILTRHEILRSIYKERDGYAYQYVKDSIDWNLTLVDGAQYRNDPASLEETIGKLISTPFDLCKDYMLRAALIDLTAEDHVLVLAIHHIASDAWSMSVIVREVAELYNAYEQNRPNILSPLVLQYADYAVWQREYLSAEVLDTKLNYWQNKLADVAPLSLPLDNVRPVVLSTRGANVSLKIEKEKLSALQALSREQGTTLYMTLLAIFKVLLYRHSGQEDISVGTSIANRPKKELEDLVGFFVNTLALRDQVDADVSFTEFLQVVKLTTLQAYEHQDVPFEKVVEKVLKDRDSSRSPLFQVMLVLHNTPEVSQLKLGDVSISGRQSDWEISKFEITFFAYETPTGLDITINYATDLYSEETINRMADHFKNLVTSVINKPLEKVGLLPMIGDAETKEILTVFNGTAIPYTEKNNVVALFEAIVKKDPKATAVVFGKEKLTYSELNEQANRVAHYLRNRGLENGDLVLLYIERGVTMLVGIMAILKAGGAYVPIDTDMPEERLRYILEDTGASMIISSADSRAGLSFAEDATIVELDGDELMLSLYPSTDPEITIDSDSLAYVIYTSGSTGRSKGVMITHNNLCDYVHGLDKKLNISACSSFALVSTIATDLGNTVLFGSLLTGGALHVFTKDQVSDSNYLGKYFDNNAIDCLKIVPSHWKALSFTNELLLTKKLLIFGGEALQASVVDKILQSDTTCKVVNHYGPTETTIGKLLHVVDADRTYSHTIPIGKPFSDTRIYVLDSELQVSGIGIAGQLYITGKGIAVGYVNNTKLTAEKFIKDPFSATGGLMYATGDLVRYLPDGNIEFIGRTDDQVKIRGYRVEIGEIERVLNQSPLVQQGVILARADKDGNRRLTGYVVPKGDFDKDGIIGHLSQYLPDYMVPSTFMELDAIPLTANGKIDRKALPDPDVNELLSGQYVAPVTSTEVSLVQIWQDILELDEIGINDDFFELGGHSLLAVRLISLIRRDLSVEIPIGDIFDYPTVAKLAKRVEEPSNDVLLPPVVAIKPRPQYIPLSFSQERLWFIDKLEGSVQYHLPSVLKLTGTVDREALAFALKGVIDRHEVLRTVYQETNGEIFQSIKAKGSWELSITNHSSVKQNAQELRTYIAQLVSQPFDLSKDNMLRANLIILSETEHVLVLTLHHIASDGWSTSIMVKELLALYSSYIIKQAAPLLLLPIQYADYAIWQRTHLAGELLNDKISYWKDKLTGVSPLELPTDHARPAMQNTQGSTVGITLSKPLTTQLQQLSQLEGVTLYMTLLSAFKVLLYRYSGQGDICVGTPIAGRQQAEVESLIGFFINTLALRTQVSGTQTYKELLQAVKTTTLEAYSHQEVPFERVVDAVVKTRDLSRSPLFQVMFVLQNTPEVPELKLGGLTLQAESYEHASSKFDLTLFLTETAEGLQGNIEYRTNLYEAETITRMAGHFEELLTAITANPKTAVANLNLLESEEKTTITDTFSQTATTAVADINVISLFEAQAEKTPKATALVFEDTEITYEELNSKSNQLAIYLQKQSVTAGTMIPVLLERSIDMIVGILGILKAGGVYVPIDPEYPHERISYILEDTGARLVLTNKANAAKLSSTNNKGIRIIKTDGEGETAQIAKEATANLKTPKPAAEQLAYVIYTSGSTGKPKGVMVGHGSLINYLQNESTSYIDAADKNSSGSYIHLSYTFDASLTAIFMPLINGKLSVIASNTQLNVFEDKNLITYAPYDFIKLTPVHLSLLEQNIPDTHKDKISKKLVIGGEALQVQHFANYIKRGIQTEIINEYGPTEATVGCSVYSFKLNGTDTTSIQDPISIGKPITNAQLYIKRSAAGSTNRYSRRTVHRRIRFVPRLPE